MTHSGGKPHAVGDLGQRYEIRYMDSESVEHVYGWSDSEAGRDQMMAMIGRHPSWHSARWIDRRV